MVKLKVFTTFILLCLLLFYVFDAECFLEKKSFTIESSTDKIPLSNLLIKKDLQDIFSDFDYNYFKPTIFKVQVEANPITSDSIYYKYCFSDGQKQLFLNYSLGEKSYQDFYIDKNQMFINHNKIINNNQISINDLEEYFIIKYQYSLFYYYKNKIVIFSKSSGWTGLMTNLFICQVIDFDKQMVENYLVIPDKMRD